jgi:hypothetical protein
MKSREKWEFYADLHPWHHSANAAPLDTTLYGKEIMAIFWKPKTPLAGSFCLGRFGHTDVRRFRVAPKTKPNVIFRI